ncbi:MAG: cob(I)yrinic acid a,c-diamide adenosyltransferase [Verrucomicrobia bacterium]|nr:MAG: cob(I)yrinic acid a,c-diamide adenosyltransferase [Verrucomicrobiota bacterium]
MSTTPISEDEHRRQMEELQKQMHAKISAAKEKKDLVIVHTGNGKGKSTAAFGMLTRMLGHAKPCAVIQFIKSGDHAAEKALKSPLLTWHKVGDGFTWDTQNRAADIARCREGWALACSYLEKANVRLLLLDELNIALAHNYLPVREVIEALSKRTAGIHVVITGRSAPKALIDAADLVTEMTEIKHPFSEGVKAQSGIEF